MTGEAPTGKLQFAEVVLDLPVDLIFTYAIPESLASSLQVGHKVLVPLGGRRCFGFVTALVARVPDKSPRPVLKIIHQVPFFPPELVPLIRWVSQYYFCSFSRALKTALPAGVRRTTAVHRLKKVGLLVGPEEAVRTASAAESRSPVQSRVLKLLAASGAMVQMNELLAAVRARPDSLKALEKKGLIRIVAEEKERDSWAREDIIPTVPLPPTSEQERALRRITESVEGRQFRVFLLHGITGSGKTEIYLQAISQVLGQGRGAIVLVPEISLTPQTGERFKARFGDTVAVIHSALSAGERHDQWLRIAAGRSRIVIGPRSAVFSPVRSLGLIVVDEEHDTSYKQAAQSPFYHARDVAVLRAKLEGAVAVLGSATPSLESYYNCRLGKYELINLTQRAQGADLPEVEIVNLRQEGEPAPSAIVFSPPLLEWMQRSLLEKRQTILFLNRRGFNTLVICRACGYTVKCRHCSVSLTYHKPAGKLVCHLCGYASSPPQTCPECRSREVRFAGMGTQRVEDLLKKFFPRAEAVRMDTDSVSFRDAHRQILSRFKTGKIDILVGTQMVAKGLDYPNVTLVGIVCADTALNLPDFRATEYTFQVLTQVTGRSGRGELKGKVIIQTYSPRHPAILAAARQEYEPFFDREIAFRKELGYPPVNHFIAVTVLSRNEEKSRRVAEHLAGELRPALPSGAEVLGPAPPPIVRIRGRYRWQLLIKTRSVVPVLRELTAVLGGMKSSRDLKVEVDVDPISML